MATKKATNVSASAAPPKKVARKGVAPPVTGARDASPTAPVAGTPAAAAASPVDKPATTKAAKPAKKAASKPAKKAASKPAKKAVAKKAAKPGKKAAAEKAAKPAKKAAAKKAAKPAKKAVAKKAAEPGKKTAADEPAGKAAPAAAASAPPKVTAKPAASAPPKVTAKPAASAPPKVTAKPAAPPAPERPPSSPALDAHVPDGDLATLWTEHKNDMSLVAPNNKRKFKVIVIGTGLAGGSAAATLGELGYEVEVFTFHDSPRRAHSIAAQGGINAAKNYKADGDSVHRLFYDTIKGGDYRSREANVHRLAEVSVNIIDQAVAQGVPFAREYGGLLDNRSFGGVQVSRTFYARGQTGQQLLLGAYQALARQISLGTVKMHTRMEMLDVVLVDGQARGVVVRDLFTGEVSSHSAHAVVLATGGYSNAFYLSTNAMHCNVTAAWRAHRKGAFFANPCYTQIHPTAIPQSEEFQSKLTLMSESLRNDGRIWVPKDPGDKRAADQIPEDERDYYLERQYPAFGNLVPRDVASRAAKRMVDSGRGVGPLENGVYLDFKDAMARLGRDVIEDRYSNLFEMYDRITGEDPYSRPMRIYPAPHYTMGGLWVDYHLMTSVPGLYCIGEANFSDHGANRLGASALMQGLADGYFVLPATIGNYLAEHLNTPPPSTDHPAFKEAEREVRDQVSQFLNIRGSRSVDWFHRELGKIVWDNCGMARSESGLKKALAEIPALRDEFYDDVRVLGSGDTLNQSLEKAGRVADFFELAELMCQDALHREESCGGHFREEHQTDEGEAMRDDEHFAYVAAWEFRGRGSPSALHRENLDFDNVELKTRSYK